MGQRPAPKPPRNRASSIRVPPPITSRMAPRLAGETPAGARACVVPEVPQRSPAARTSSAPAATLCSRGALAVFSGGMEAQLLPVLHGVVQAPLAAGQEGQVPFPVVVEVHGFLLLELVEGLALAGHPARRHVGDRLVDRLHAVLVL